MKKILKKILFGENKVQLHTIKFFAPRGIKLYLNAAIASKTILGFEEFETQSFFVNYSKLCNYFIDIGSSNGYYGVLYKKYNKTGTVYSFEPKEQFWEIQKKNFEVNHAFHNVTIINKYAAESDDEKHVNVNLLLPFKSQNIFMKIDIDGGEVSLINSIKELLRDNNCFLIVETHGTQLEIDSLLIMKELGYKTQIIDQGWYRVGILKERRDAIRVGKNRWFIAYK